MAPMPAAAPADMPPDDGAPAPGADAMGGDDQSGQVLCTVLKNPDGGYTLVPGDEEDASAGPAEGEMGGDMAPAKPEGQTYSEPGALLKGVLDILTKDQEAGSGPAQDHFEAGYNDDAGPTPKKAPPKF